MGDQQYIPITALSPFAGSGQSQTVRARVSEKGDLRVFTKKNDQSQGKLFSCVLNDENSSIRATFFNESADQWYGTLNNGEVYYFSNFTVKNANKQFNSTNNDYELTFDGRSTVHRCKNESSIPSGRYNFSLITVLPNKPKNSQVDVLGVVLDVGSVESIESKKAPGSQLTKRTAVIAEPSGNSIEVCFWGDDVTQADQWAVGNVVALKGLRVSDWNTISLTWGRNSAGAVSPPHMPDVGKYAAWYRSNNVNVNSVNALSKKSSAFGGATGDDADAKKDGKVRFHNRQFLNYFEENVGKELEKVDYVDAVVHVSRFSKSTDGTYWYIACPKCQKKVTPTNDGSNFRCAKCEIEYSEPQTVPRYIFQAEVNDRVCSKWVTFFDEGGKAFFGKDARKLKEEMEEAQNNNPYNNPSASQSPDGGDQQRQYAGSDVAKLLNQYLNTPIVARFRCNLEKYNPRNDGQQGMSEEEAYRTKYIVTDCFLVKKNSNRPLKISHDYIVAKKPDFGPASGSLVLVDEIDSLFNVLAE